MRKYLSFISACLLAATALTSCEKDTEDTTSTTYYPVIELNGETIMRVALGSDFTEPGYSATEGDTDITAKVTTSVTNVATGETLSSVPTDAVGMYRITYKAVNVDGFSKTTSRDVIVYNPAVHVMMAGSYDTDMTATLYGTAGKTFADYAASYGFTDQCTGITFTELAPGFYYCNDLFAGWYSQVRGYAATNGTRYDMTGYISVNDDNSLTLLSSYVAGWGDSLDWLTGSFDPATSTISYDLSYAGQISMSIVLNMVQDGDPEIGE